MGAFVDQLVCQQCGDAFLHKRGGQLYCSRACNDASHNKVTDEKRKQKGQELTAARNSNFTRVNRDRYINKLDARYTGPANKSDTSVNVLRRDKVTQAPLSVDIPTPKLPTKFVQYDPLEYETYSERQRQVSHTESMPRLKKNFCTQCVEEVVGEDGKTIRRTKGTYLPIEHKCNSVRVYNLRGELLEVKEL